MILNEQEDIEIRRRVKLAAEMHYSTVDDLCSCGATVPGEFERHIFAQALVRMRNEDS